MQKVAKILVLLFAIAIFAVQFIRPDQTNPPENPLERLEAVEPVDRGVAEILKRSCSDCHSNTTVYPWYAQVSPFSWFLDDHIREGRRHLNFSEWGKYQTSQKTKKLEEICETVQTGEMPLPSYLWIHRAAALRDGESERICQWADQLRRTLQ